MESFVVQPLIVIMFWLNTSELTSENESDKASTKTSTKLNGIPQYGPIMKISAVPCYRKAPDC